MIGKGEGVLWWTGLTITARHSDAGTGTGYGNAVAIHIADVDIGDVIWRDEGGFDL